jgi:hypothetical protein
LLGDNGTVIGSTAFYIDVTPDPTAQEQVLTEALAVVIENRSAIEQVKKWRSQPTNIKIRPLADQLLEEFLELNNGEFLPTRPMFDTALLTAHRRANKPRAFAQHLRPWSS